MVKAMTNKTEMTPGNSCARSNWTNVYSFTKCIQWQTQCLVDEEGHQRRKCQSKWLERTRVANPKTHCLGDHARVTIKKLANEVVYSTFVVRLVQRQDVSPRSMIGCLMIVN